MKVIYMGTSQFAVAPLMRLASAHDVLAVFTKADSVKNRGKKLEPTPVKVSAENLGLEVFTPSTLKSVEVLALIQSLKPDIIVVASYGMILPAEILMCPKFGCINIHASLLPRWRGASPVERAILAGEDLQGVSIMRMEEGLDTGDFCKRVELNTKNMCAGEILVELSNLGADALIDALTDIENGSAIWTKQDESQVTYAHKIEKSELNISPNNSAQDNYRLVLASSNSHVSKCCINGKPVRILQCSISSTGDNLAGRVQFLNGNLLLDCVEDSLVIQQLKPDGKKEMDAKSYASGVQGIKQGSIEWSAI